MLGRWAIWSRRSESIWPGLFSNSHNLSGHRNVKVASDIGFLNAPHSDLTTQRMGWIGMSASVSLFQGRDCKFTFVKEPDTGVPTGFYVSDKYGAYCLDKGDKQQLVEVLTGPKTADGKWPPKVFGNDVVNGELVLHNPAVDTVETAISAHVGILDCQGVIASTPGA